ncbi:MAG: Gfo/Idh/MocA family protein [bacterium]
MNFAIVGCGNIGRRRANCISEMRDGKLVAVADSDLSRAKALGEEFGCQYSSKWEEVVRREDVEAVVVATSNDWHAPISIAAIKARKHVLCEKPLARNVEEAECMVREARENGVLLKTGFNHRFHPQVKKAKELMDRGVIGRPIFLRGRTGHGGGDAFAKRWFAQKAISGGGTFLDNGVHLLDLARWFMGEFAEAKGYVATNLWNMDVEDNGFGLFKTPDGRVAMLQSSWTEWKGYLYLEIYGENGYVYIDYNPRRTILGEGRRLIGEPPVKEKIFEFSPKDDRAFFEDTFEFAAAIREGREPLGSGVDGLEAIKMAYAVYRSSAEGKAIKLA